MHYPKDVNGEKVNVIPEYGYVFSIGSLKRFFFAFNIRNQFIWFPIKAVQAAINQDGSDCDTLVYMFSS